MSYSVNKRALDFRECKHPACYFCSELDGEPYNPPLSWRLTEKQKNNLEDAWTNDPTIKHTVECMQKFWDDTTPWPIEECSKSGTIKEIANNQSS